MEVNVAAVKGTPLDAFTDAALGEEEDEVFSELLLVPWADGPDAAGEATFDGPFWAWSETSSGGGVKGEGDTCAVEAAMDAIHSPSILIKMNFLILYWMYWN